VVTKYTQLADVLAVPWAWNQCTDLFDHVISLIVTTLHNPQMNQQKQLSSRLLCLLSGSNYLT
jgi:hypothetical protein